MAIHLTLDSKSYGPKYYIKAKELGNFSSPPPGLPDSAAFGKLSRAAGMTCLQGSRLRGGRGERKKIALPYFCR